MRIRRALASPACSLASLAQLSTLVNRTNRLKVFGLAFRVIKARLNIKRLYRFRVSDCRRFDNPFCNAI
jgi:hypothetical protein